MKRVKVIRVFDGDTFLASRWDKSFVIRLNWIDTPEVQRQKESRGEIDDNQWMWGRTATDYFQQIIDTAARPGFLWIEERDVDKNERILADVFTDYRFLFKDNVQLKLLKTGLATDFFPRMEEMVLETDYRRLSLFMSMLKSRYFAERHQEGFWSDSNFMRPFNYRQTWYKNL